MTTRPCRVEIRTRFLEDNFRFLLSLAAPHAELMAVVKADAYGHSAALCVPAVARAGARWLGVATVEEGVAARTLCPEAKVLVLCGAFAGQGAAAVEHRLSVVAWQPWQLDELKGAARTARVPAGSLPIHLEIDTGMSRQGIALEEFNPEGGSAGALLARFHPGSPLRLEGVMTHLLAADEADGRVTAAQMTLLEEVLRRIEVAGLHPEWLHAGNSAALVAGETGRIAALAARYGMKAMLRPGLALYGVTPQFNPDFEPSGPPEPASLAAARARLQPVMAWKTCVAGVRAVPAGAVVGYNGTFVATEPMRLALVAAGYADGLDRRLGNRFSLLVHGMRAPLVGQVSMDTAVVDVTEIPGVEPGDEVVILGEQGGERITAYDHAEATGTIPWEVFTRIGARVPRIAV
ncbi:MAG: alanine racemase [Terracidiphilus sp.]|jgi:alanine racemase